MTLVVTVVVTSLVVGTAVVADVTIEEVLGDASGSGGVSCDRGGEGMLVGTLFLMVVTVIVVGVGLDIWF